MKIAIALENNQVSQHFGYCDGFAIFTIKEKTSIESEFVENPGHKPGFLPNFLKSLDVNLVIAGGMGGNAIAIFNQHNIDVITGASGNKDAILAQYLDGTLTSTQSACHQHLHKDTCH